MATSQARWPKACTYTTKLSTRISDECSFLKHQTSIDSRNSSASRYGQGAALRVFSDVPVTSIRRNEEKRRGGGRKDEEAIIIRSANRARLRTGANRRVNKRA